VSATTVPLAAYMDALAEVEARAPVLAWRADGVPLWPLVRLRWMFGEWASSAKYARGSAAGITAVQRAQRVAGLALGPLRAAWTNAIDHHGPETGAADPPDPARHVVFLSDGLSFASLGGRWVERFCDPLLRQARECGWRGSLWTPLHRYLRPRHSPSRFVQPAVDAAMARAVLGAAPRSLHLPGHRDTVRMLQARGFVAATLAAARIERDSRRLLAVASTYERLLASAAPRAAFVVSYYSLEGVAFVLACRRLGIPSIEIQHGVQGPHHAAYAAWPRPEPRGVHALLPDRFWVWSAQEAAVIERWCASSGHGAFVGGNPWLDVWRSDSTWPGAAEALAAARAARQQAAGSRPVVLVTLQFGLADSEQLAPLERVIERDGGRSMFWVRLHPVMHAERGAVRARFARHAHCEVDRPSDLPLHALLPYADVHLTHSSSTVLETAPFGLRSVVTGGWGVELFAEQVESGEALVELGDADAVLATLARAVSLRRSPATGAQHSPPAALRLLLDQLSLADRKSGVTP
jgi:hypothetical protein